MQPSHTADHVDADTNMTASDTRFLKSKLYTAVLPVQKCQKHGIYNVTLEHLLPGKTDWPRSSGCTCMLLHHASCGERLVSAYGLSRLQQRTYMHSGQFPSVRASD